MAYHPHKGKRNNHTRLDSLVSFVAVVSPIMTLPQVYLIYSTQNAEGVSAFSWIAYVATSLIWLLYGLAHHEKPIVINSAIGAGLSSLIAVGAIAFGSA